MPLHIYVVPEKGVGANKAQVKTAVKALATAVGMAITKALPADATYQQWFGNAVQANVSTVLLGMQAFLQSSNTLSVKVRGKDATQASYAYVIQDTSRNPGSAGGGQWFIYLGPRAFGGLTAYQSGAGVRDILLLTLAHELSHHFRTNANGGGYATEHYDAAAEALVSSNAAYAAHNADNFGYYIEACA